MPAFKVEIDSSLTGESENRFVDVNIQPDQTIDDFKTVITLNGVNADPEVTFTPNKFFLSSRSPLLILCIDSVPDSINMCSLLSLLILEFCILCLSFLFVTFLYFITLYCSNFES